MTKQDPEKEATAETKMTDPQQADTAERIIEQLGVFGSFQRILLAVCLLTEVPVAGAMLLMAFAGAKSPWMCKDNATDPAPLMSLNFSGNTSMDVCTPEGEVCPGRVYTLDLSSVVTEWDLVCNNDWISDTISSIQMAGVVVGAFTAGPLADMIGRKPILYIVYIVVLIGTLVSAFSINWMMFAAMRFFIGVGIGGIMIVNINLPMEYIGRKYRVLCSGIPTWSVGSVIMALLAYLLRDWRHLSIAIAVMGMPLLVSWWFTPESIRWLIAHGQVEKAEQIMERIAKFNKREKADASLLSEMKKAEEEKKQLQAKKYTYKDLFTSREIRRRALMMGFIWIVNGLVYYGLAFGVKNLAGDRFLNLSLIGLLECVAQPAAGFLNEKIDRRKSSMGFYALASIASLIVLIIVVAAPEMDMLKTAFAMVAWLGISGGWTAVQTCTAELFPTVIRNIGYGFCSTLARLSSIAGPQIVYIGKYSSVAPYIIYSGLTFLVVVVLVFMPETKGKPLREFIRRPSMYRRESNSFTTDAKSEERLSHSVEMDEMPKVDV